jgi:hypothetical protein
LSGVGLDNLIRNQRQNIWASVVLFIVGIILLGLLIWISAAITDVNVSGYWQQILNYIATTREAGTNPRLYSDSEFIKMSAGFAVKDLLRSALICFLLAILFFAVKYHRLFAYAIAILAIVEIFIFANASKQSFDFNTLKESDMGTFLRERPGDYRIFNYANPNSAMSIGERDIWGYDSAVPLRYAEFMSFAQPGLNPDNERQRLDFKRPESLLSMIRCRYLFIPQHGKNVVLEIKDVMNRIQLISHWQVIDKRDDIFKEMDNPTFDPRQTVILETSPNIKSVQNGNIGECTIEDSSTDYLTIKGKLEQPALLLITDSYSKGWQVKPLADSSQKKYQVMPANYTLMAIPLYAGEHHLRLEYKPKAFVVGKWISLSALIVYLMLILIAVGRSTILGNIVTKFLNKRKRT